MMSPLNKTLLRYLSVGLALIVLVACGGGGDDPPPPQPPPQPAIISSMYLGGAGVDKAYAMVATSTGIYITGATYSTNFTATSSSITTSDVFVTKMDIGGTSTGYTVSFGGSGDDEGRGIAIDTDGNAYITGSIDATESPVISPDCATTTRILNPIEGTRGVEAFIVKINPVGQILYCTLLGGQGTDKGMAIALDSVGNPYVTGSTLSADFPKVASLQASCAVGGNTDAFVTMVNPTGTTAVYSTRLGGSASDEGKGIAVDSTGNAYITGNTKSGDFPFTTNAFQKIHNKGSIGGSDASDAFFTKIVPTGTSTIYSTYLGGAGEDFGNAIAVGTTGIAHITGGSTNDLYVATTTDVEDIGTDGTDDVFVVGIDSAGFDAEGNTVPLGDIEYITYIQGGYNDVGLAIVLDNSTDNVYITGKTSSNDFEPLISPTQAMNAGPTTLATSTTDAFVLKINTKNNTPLFSTYLGGVADDVGHAIALGQDGIVYVTGETNSQDFSIVSPLQSVLNGSTDIFIRTFKLP